MSDLSDYAEEQICKWAFSDAAATRPTSWYLALYTSAPDDTGGGVEVSGAGYARAPVTFAYDTNGQAANTAEVTITATGGDFGSVVAVGIFDGPTAANLWAHKALESAITMDSGTTFSIAEGGLTIRLA